jgi:hypothetical protein
MAATARGCGRSGCLAVGWGCLLPLVLVLLWWVRGTPVIVLAVPFLIYLLVRLTAIALVGASMRKGAGRAQPVEPLAAVPSGSPPERKLCFRLLDESKDLALTPSQHACLQQASRFGTHTWRLFKRSMLVSLAGTLVVALLWKWCAPAGLARNSFEISFVWMGLTLQLLLLVVLARSTFVSVYRIPAGFLVSYYLLMVAPLAAFLFWGSGRASKDPMLYCFYLPIGAGAAMLVHGYRRLAHHLGQLGDHPLLVLRVFGSDSNAAFVFGEILLRWCFLGSVATIADPSYVRFQGSLAARQNRRYLVIFTAAFVAWVLLAATLGALLLGPFLSAPVSALGGVLGWVGRVELASVVTCALLVPPLLALVVLLVRRNFKDARRRLSAEPQRPRSTVTMGGIFRRFVHYCHDDVWKRAVTSLLPKSQVVLMDVRGFSPERRGCEYEMGLLIDRFPIARVVLLADAGATQEALLSTLEQRWDVMSENSPNRWIEEPVLTVYQPGVEDPGDIERILALLAGALPATPEPAGSSDAPEGLVIPGHKATKAARRGWGERLGGLDLAVSTPARARILIPVILIGLAFYTYIRVQPVVEAYTVLAAPRLLPVASLAEAAKRPAGPDPPFSATARAQLNPPDQKTAGVYLFLTLKGGPVSRAERGWIRDLVVLGSNRQPLPLNENLAKPTVAEDSKVSTAEGELHLTATLQPPVVPDRLAVVSGHAVLEFEAPDDVLVIDQLDKVLPGRGWVRLSHPRLAPLGQVDLVRLASDDGLTIRQHADEERVRVHLIKPDGTSAEQFQIGFKQFANYTVKAEDLASVRLKISLGTSRLERVGFEVRDIPVAKP